MVAHSPSDRALFARCAGLVGLALDTYLDKRKRQVKQTEQNKQTAFPRAFETSFS
jgi:hypothetical protein